MNEYVFFKGKLTFLLDIQSVHGQKYVKLFIYERFLGKLLFLGVS
jgi:hypothetical protein